MQPIEMGEKNNRAGFNSKFVFYFILSFSNRIWSYYLADMTPCCILYDMYANSSFQQVLLGSDEIKYIAQLEKMSDT